MSGHVNLIKLCVGAEGPESLQRWQRSRFGAAPPLHVTRMWPKRDQELLAGGSIYWVFKGVMLARQRVQGLEETTGSDGIRRCGLRLDPALVRVTATPRRPFQGWRYLEAADAPADLPPGREAEDALPPRLAAELAAMGLV